MKMLFGFIFFFALSGFNAALSYSAGEGSQLIAPTRSLEEAGKAAVRVTVFSEPPGLNVFLDGSDVGKTPLWLDQVEPGTHQLRIKDIEREIYLKPRQPLKVGLFKGSFIMLPGEEKQITTDEQTGRKVKEAGGHPAPTETRKREDLTMWERFLNGTLPYF